MFHIKAKIINSGKVLNVEADKDDLIVTFNAEKTEAQASLAKLFMADHDFTLVITFLESCKPHIVIEKGRSDKDGILKHHVLMLNFFPELNEADLDCHHEFIFVVDQSGSMEGERIDSARDALLLFVKSLPIGSYFNIVGFGDEFKLLFPRQVNGKKLMLLVAWQTNPTDHYVALLEVVNILRKP